MTDKKDNKFNIYYKGRKIELRPVIVTYNVIEKVTPIMDDFTEFLNKSTGDVIGKDAKPSDQITMLMKYAMDTATWSVLEMYEYLGYLAQITSVVAECNDKEVKGIFRETAESGLSEANSDFWKSQDLNELRGLLKFFRERAGNRKIANPLL